jgi:hypothetical protein
MANTTARQKKSMEQNQSYISLKLTQGSDGDSTFGTLPPFAPEAD